MVDLLRDARSLRPVRPGERRYDHQLIWDLWTQGTPKKAIARQLGCDPQTVRSALRRPLVPSEGTSATSPPSCMTDGCAEPVFIKKSGLCKRCYHRQYYQAHRPRRPQYRCVECGASYTMPTIPTPRCATCLSRIKNRKAYDVTCRCGAVFRAGNRNYRWCPDCRDKGLNRLLYHSGRPGAGHRRLRRNRALVLAKSDTCWLCGHPGAKTVDHVIPAARWPVGPDGKRLPGLDDLANLAPAHGTLGRGRGRHNAGACPTCGLLCNQARGTRRALLPAGITFGNGGEHGQRCAA